MKPVALLTHLCALTMLTACTASTQSLKLSESPTRALQETRRLTGAPGIAALVHHRGTTVFFEVDGHRINKSAARITPADSFHLGSNTQRRGTALKWRRRQPPGPVLRLQRQPVFHNQHYPGF